MTSSVVTRPAPNSGGYRYLAVDAITRRVTCEFSFSGVTYTFERNAPGDFTASIDIYSSQTQYLVPQQTYIVVERSGRPFWVGFLWQPKRDNKKLTINAQGIWSVFGHRHIRERRIYDAQDRAVMLRDLVTYGQQGTSGDLGVTVGTEVFGGISYSQVYEWWDNKSIMDAASDVTDFNPRFTFRIEGSWQSGNILGLNFVIDTTFPVLTPHRLVYGGNAVDYGWDPLSPSPNHIDAFGGFDDFSMIRQTVQNSDALTRQPRIEGSVENRNLMVSDPALAMAQSALKRMSNSPVQPTIIMLADSEPVLGTLLPGYQVQVSISDGPYIQVDGDYIVNKISVTVPDGSANIPGVETVTYEFESLTEDITTVILPLPINPIV